MTVPGNMNKALRHQLHSMADALGAKYSQEPFVDEAGTLLLRIWKPSHVVTTVGLVFFFYGIHLQTSGW